MDDGDPRAGRTEDARADGRARAVGGIEHEAQTARVDPGGELEAVRTIVAEASGGIDHAPKLGVRRAGQLLGPPDELLQLVLDRIVELEPLAVEDLETVVERRVV